MYKRDALVGGHVIMLGKNCEEAAANALQVYPGGLQIGGKFDYDYFNQQIYYAILCRWDKFRKCNVLCGPRSFTCHCNIVCVQ